MNSSKHLLVKLTEPLFSSGISITYFAVGYIKEQTFFSPEIQMIHIKYCLNPAKCVPKDIIKVLAEGLTEEETTLLRGIICKDIHTTGDLTEEELMRTFEELR